MMTVDRRLNGERGRIFTILAILLFVVALTGGLSVLVLQADPGSIDKVDPQIWLELRGDPNRQTTFNIILDIGIGETSDESINDQITFTDLLESLSEIGIIDWYIPYYGENLIVVSGSAESIRYLRDIPNVVAISPYNGEQELSSAFRNSAIEATGRISGTVYGPDGMTPLEGIEVRAYFQVGPLSWTVADTTASAANGTYGFNGLETGIYRVRFRDPNGAYVTEYYNNKLTFSSANAFVVIDGQNTTGIDAIMEIAGHITGKVTGPDGKGVKDVGVGALRFDGSSWQIFASDLTDNKGDFDIGGLISDTYRVQYHDVFLRFVTEYYDNWSSVNDADNVIVTSGETVSGIDAELGPYGSITGTVTGLLNQQAIEGISVTIYENNNYANIAGFTDTDSSGNYFVGGLGTKDYQVEFYDPTNYYTAEFYDDQTDIVSADNVSATLGLSTGNINATLSPPTSTVTNTLVSGWNLISLPILPEDPEVAVTLSSITGTYEIIWAHDVCDPPATQWKRYDPDVAPQFNTLHEIKAQNGLWLQMFSPETLEVNGWEYDEYPVELCIGWNLVGYPSLTPRPIEEALADITGKYEVVFQYVAADVGIEWKKYDPDLPFGNTLTTMEPGYGYWIQMNEAATLIFSNR